MAHLQKLALLARLDEERKQEQEQQQQQQQQQQTISTISNNYIRTVSFEVVLNSLITCIEIPSDK